MMHHIIYKTTNLLNGRFYIGMHCTMKLEDGYLGSGKRIRAEIKKHGKENFERKILEILPCKKTLKAREAEIVNHDMRSDPLCLNLKNGGEGGWDHLNTDSDVQRRKGEKGIARIKELEDDKEWVATRARNQSESMKLAYAEGRKEVKMPSWVGRKHSEETKAKISASRNKPKPC